LPWLLRRKLSPVGFRVNDALGRHYWLLDPVRCTVEVRESPPPRTVQFEAHAAVVNDCARLKMFSVWTASKRIKIHLPDADALRVANLWFTLLDLYEVDLLPLHKNLSPRALAVRARRWREPAELANILLRRLFLRQRFSVDQVYPLAKAGSKSDSCLSARQGPKTSGSSVSRTG
jgi:hypothetical protein